jgi:uncharacterized protein (TIGR03437 family)
LSGTLSITATSGDKAAAAFSLTVLSLAPSDVSILNGASFTPAISPGSLVTIFGSTLTPTIEGVVSSPSEIGAYTVTFGGYAARILQLINQNGIQQINAQVPFEMQPGPATVAIGTPQGSTAIDNIAVSPAAPGIFTSGVVSVNGTAYPLAVALRPDGSYVSSSNAVRRGETITFFATGLGQTIPTAITGFPGMPGQLVATPVYAGINHQGVSVVSAVYSSGALGVYAVTVVVPESAVPGPGQPLSLYLVDATGTGYSAPEAYIPIQ